MAARNVFDPENIKKEDMEKLGKHIEEYLELFLEVMVIPEELIEDIKEEMDEAIKRTKKLVKKLKEGKSSVFKDADEWNSVI